MELLRDAEIQRCELLPWGSNYTFLAQLDGGGAGPGLAVYKPQRGEAPLYDFPDGTLYRREYASYVVSEALGWRFVPPTVIRDGPHGPGSVQLFIGSVPGASYYTFREERAEELRRFAAFDCLANNADRKGGHCLPGFDGRLWGIDHGLTFNTVPKLRTVIWEFRSQPVPDFLLKDMEQLLSSLERRSSPVDSLEELLSAAEVEALCRRLDGLLNSQRFPEPGPYRSVPWPNV